MGEKATAISKIEKPKSPLTQAVAHRIGKHIFRSIKRAASPDALLNKIKKKNTSIKTKNNRVAITKGVFRIIDLSAFFIFILFPETSV